MIGPDEQRRREIDEEIDAHLQARVDHLIARGMAPDAARAEALRRFGDLNAGRARLLAQAAADGRRRRLRDRAEALWQDGRYVARSLARQPVFALGVIATLTLGLGINAAVFRVADRVLLRPRSSALQVLGREMTLRRIGRLLQGAVILGWGWSALHLPFTPSRVSLLLLAVAGGVALFEGLLILQATLAFWTIESLEMMNVLTYGGVTTAQYPLAIYPLWLRRFFTFVVPLACFSYFPLLAVLDRPHDPLLAWLSPLFGVVFLFVSLVIWRVGVRRYTSTGS